MPDTTSTRRDDAEQRPDNSLAVRLLDGFEVLRAGRGVQLADAGERLVALLALRGRPVDRQQLAGTLWADVEDHRAAQCLRSTLHRVHRVVPDLLRSSDRRLAVAPWVEVDVTAAEAAADALLGHEEHPGEQLRDLCVVLLPGWYDDWVTFERERLRQRFLHALECLATARLQDGRSAEAIEAALAASAMEPLRESARRLLVEAHLAEGNVSEAMREYEAFAHLLDCELGIGPTAAMVDLLPVAARPTS